MSTIHLSEEFYGHPIVSISNGQIIAKVEDILIDPSALEVAAMVTGKRGGGLLKREQEVDLILGEQVKVWGQDVVLVSGANVVVTRSKTSGSEQWLSVTEQLRGCDVISIDGRRIGQLNDVVLDVEGRLLEYDLGQVLIEGPIAQSKRIAIQETQALGKDVLVIKAMETAAKTEPAQTAEAAQPEQAAAWTEPAKTAEWTEPAKTAEATEAAEAEEDSEAGSVLAEEE